MSMSATLIIIIAFNLSLGKNMLITKGGVILDGHHLFDVKMFEQVNVQSLLLSVTYIECKLTYCMTMSLSILNRYINLLS